MISTNHESCPALESSDRPGPLDAWSWRAKPYRSFAALYDALMGDRMFPMLRRNFEWVARRYRLRPRAAADVACGTGTFVRYLTGIVDRVYGVDRSLSMLRIARARTSGTGATLLLQDLRALRLPHPVDVITCNFDSLNYLLTIRDLARALGALHANLERGGHAIFDMVTDVAREADAGVSRQDFVFPRGRSTWRISWDASRRFRRVTIVNMLAGERGYVRVGREIHVQRAYPIRVVVLSALACGLAVRGVHDAASLQSAGSDTYRAVYVVQRV